jgi:hypothetical protein
MQIKRQSRFVPGSVKSPSLEDIVVLVDSAGVALGAGAFDESTYS